MGNSGSVKKLWHRRDKRKSEENGKAPLNIVLIGQPNNGKSTIFKQMTLKYGRGYSEHARKNSFGKAISRQTILYMKVLLIDPATIDKITGHRVPVHIIRAAAKILLSKTDRGITPEIAENIKILWNEPVIKEVFQSGTQVRLPDTVPHFFERVDALAQPSYVPTDEDFLRYRESPSTSRSAILKVPELDMRVNLVDANKCVACRDGKKDATCLMDPQNKIFLVVVSLSKYDQVSLQDDPDLVNFTMLIQSKNFINTRFILYFNKIDAFKSKLEDGVQFLLDGYDGPQGDYEAISGHIVRTFLSRNKMDREVVPLFGTAIDSYFDCIQILDASTGYFQRRNVTSEALRDTTGSEVVSDLRDIILDFLFAY